MTTPAQPRVVRLVSGAMAAGGLVIIGISAVLWILGDDGSIPLVSVVLFAFGGLEILGSLLFRGVLGRQVRSPDRDGAGTTYYEGDKPPGMV